MAKEKKKKEKNSVILPKAWQSVKHRNETAQAKSNYDDTWKALGVVITILVILFVLLGGISQTKVISFFFDWSHKVGESISNWIEGGSIIQNEDGIYWDPSGQKGDKIGGDDSSSDEENSSNDENSSNNEQNEQPTNSNNEENNINEVQNE